MNKILILICLLITTIILTGCITSNTYYEVTIVEKYPAEERLDDNLVKISDGDILKVRSQSTFNELKINHTYIVEIGSMSTSRNRDKMTIGIEQIIREVK